MNTDTNFVVRPIAVSTSSGKFNTDPLDAQGSPGVNFEVRVAQIAGTSAQLKLAVQTGVDGLNWADVEGEVSMTAPGVLQLFRLGIQRWVRLRGELAGTTPSATYAIDGNWVSMQTYPLITASIDDKPLTQGGTANLSGTTGIAGALVQWDLTFDQGPSEGGTVTADNNGDWTAMAEVPLEAANADLFVYALGQEETDNSPVVP